MQSPSQEPPIIISYHNNDSEWEIRLVTSIKAFRPSSTVLTDQELDPERHAELTPSIREALENAKALVVLLSSSYIRSSWVMSVEALELIRLLVSKGLLIVPVIIRPCRWQATPFFSYVSTRPVTSTPVTYMGSDWEIFFDKVARQISNHLEANLDVSLPIEQSTTTESQPSDEPSRFSFSSEVNRVIDLARFLATTSESSKHVTTSCLLFALAETGRDTSSLNKTPRFLFNQLTGNNEEAYRKEFISKFPRQPYPDADHGPIPPKASVGEEPTMSSHAIKTLELAREISKITYLDVPTNIDFPPEGEIHARHLLAALLTGPASYGVLARLSRIVSNTKKLRADFFIFIKENLPLDNQSFWQDVLLGGGDEPSGTVTDKSDDGPALPPPLPPPPLVAGFMADYWEGHDLLDITPDVNALASVIAAFKVEPPLAIGLFGEWGSGKSHFMRQLKARIETLSRAARKSNLPQNQLGYYKNIVQIEFNAWHYIEGNLWASLVDHIFANLRISEKEHSSLVDARREELMKQLGVKKEIVAEKKGLLKAKEDGIRARVIRVNDRKDTVYQDLERLKDDLEVGLLNNLNIPISFSSSDKNLLARIGIDTTGLVKAADVHTKYQETRGLWQGLKAQIKVIRSQPKRRLLFLLTVLIALLPVVALLLKNLVHLNISKALLGSTATTIIAGLIAMKPYFDEFRKSWAVLKKKEEAIQNERQQQIVQLEKEIQELTKQALEAEREAADVKKQAEKLEEEIESVTASKLIAQFIEDRAAATDYRRHLGLLALIRRDFEKLRDLFREQRAAEDNGTESPANSRINRIVLYIDDLDRCPPERVVQVLQAIHLLLAFPLFVVVVGVDSRWVTRALEDSYEWLSDHDDAFDTASNGNKEPGSRNREDEESNEGATPHDYLEKIFQIPFWLKPMNASSCIDFLDGLKLDADSEPANKIKVDRSDTPVAIQKPLVKKDEPKVMPAGVVAGSVDVVQTSPPIAVEAQPASIGTNELQPLKDTPAVSIIETEQDDHHDELKDIDVAPRSLQFQKFEIDYIKELAPLIGRSPRAVKRFLNCYRLVKVSLTEKQFDSFIGTDGNGSGYKAAMILLGIITGTPKVSAKVIEIIERDKGIQIRGFFGELATSEEIWSQNDGKKLRSFLDMHLNKPGSNEVFAEMLKWSSRVSRFSFRIVDPDPFGRMVPDEGKA